MRLRMMAIFLALAPPLMAGAAQQNARSAERPQTSSPSDLEGAERLQAEIARIAAVSKGVVGVSAIHLPSGRRIDYNADSRFNLASLLKVPLAVYALHLGETGRLSLTQAFPIARADMLEPGVLYEHFRHPGLAISTLNAIELSITKSDNGATDFVFSRVGGPAAVASWLQSINYGDIDIGRVTLKELFAEPDPTQPPPPVAASDLSRTATPRSMTRFLADLHAGRLIGAASAGLLIDIMSRTEGERISLLLPPGVRVFHKTGTNFEADTMSVNDVGFIQAPNGETIAISVFIKGSPTSVSHGTRDRVIGHISRSVYDHFQLGPRAADMP